MHEDELLNPQHDPAQVRAFFVHPAWTRLGIGRSILTACEQEIIESGFKAVEIVATPAGEPLYLSFVYTAEDRHEIAWANGLGLPVVWMTKK
jgi:GNAT superfamily N-acetyltransferase